MKIGGVVEEHCLHYDSFDSYDLIFLNHIHHSNQVNHSSDIYHLPSPNFLRFELPFKLEPGAFILFKALKRWKKIVSEKLLEPAMFLIPSNAMELK